MFEYIIQTFLSLDLLGMGAFITLFALSIGIAYLIANGSTKVFLYTIIIINYAVSIGIFIMTKEAVYALLTTIITIIIMLIPDGITELIYKDQQK